MDQTPQNMGKRGERITSLKGHLVTIALIFVRMGWAGVGRGGGGGTRQKELDGVKVAGPAVSMKYRTSEGGAELQQIRTCVRVAC